MTYECPNPDCPNFPVFPERKEDPEFVGPFRGILVGTILELVRVSRMAADDREVWLSENGYDEFAEMRCVEKGITREEFDREFGASLTSFAEGLLTQAYLWIRATESVLYRMEERLRQMRRMRDYTQRGYIRAGLIPAGWKPE